MAINLLSARKVETAPVKNKPYWLKDGGSLFLWVQPNNSKLWRYRYRIAGRPNMFAIGKYPEVTLESARAERDAARALIKKGIHPSLDRKANFASQVEANETTFQSVAKKWIAANKGWTSAYKSQVETNLAKYVFTKIGMLPIGEVKAGHLRPLMLSVAEAGAETIAILIRQWSSQIFSYAGTHGIPVNDPTPQLKGLVKRPQVKHNPPLTWEEVPEFLNKLDSWAGYRTTVLALQLMSATFVRTVELRKAAWKEFDLNNAMWIIPKERMKMRRPHLVPLSAQAVAALIELRTLTGGGTFLFPNYRRPTQVMSPTTLNRALDCLGFRGRFSSHGFRSTATTLLGLLGYPDKLVDRQLAHGQRDSSRAPYDHTKFINSRRIMMQDWADILDALKAGKTVAQVTVMFGPLSTRRVALLKVSEHENQ